MLLDGDYMEHKEYTEEEKQYVYHVWEIMYDSYFQLKKDGKSKLVLQQSYDLMMLAWKISNLEYVCRLLEQLESSNDILPEDDFIRHKQALLAATVKHDPDFVPQYFESIEYNVNRVKKKVEALQNKYNRSKKENDREVSEQVDNVFSVIVRVANRLKMQLDAHKISVTEWLAYEQQAKDLIKAEEESARKGRKK